MLVQWWCARLAVSVARASSVGTGGGRAATGLGWQKMKLNFPRYMLRTWYGFLVGLPCKEAIVALLVREIVRGSATASKVTVRCARRLFVSHGVADQNKRRFASSPACKKRKERKINVTIYYATNHNNMHATTKPRTSFFFSWSSRLRSR